MSRSASKNKLTPSENPSKSNFNKSPKERAEKANDALKQATKYLEHCMMARRILRSLSGMKINYAFVRFHKLLVVMN